MNFLQIFGFEDIKPPDHDHKGVLVRSGLHKSGFNSLYKTPTDYAYRQRSSPIICSNDGCSVKRVGKGF